MRLKRSVFFVACLIIAAFQSIYCQDENDPEGNEVDNDRRPEDQDRKEFIKSLNESEHTRRPLLNLLMAATINETTAGMLRHNKIKPLFLTPFVLQDRASVARKLSRVKDLPGASPVLQQFLTSYAGYITVNEDCGNHLYFWFFPRPGTDGRADPSPLLVWLQGGPGASSLFGLFVENGPLRINEDLTLALRTSSWLQHTSILYIDQPVGTGFSFTEKAECYAKSEDDIARDLAEFLRQFYLIYPEYLMRPLYIGGQSYAGKYVPALAYKLHTDSMFSFVPLAGIVVGNGFSDPINMIDYATFLEGNGIIDRKQGDFVRFESDRARRLIKEQRWIEAYAVIDALIVGAFYPYGTVLKNITGISHYYNLLRSGHPADMLYYQQYLSMKRVRRAIHVGSRMPESGAKVRINLLEDMMQSVAPLIAEIADSYKILWYSGQLDLIVNYPLVENFWSHLKWSGTQQWAMAKRQPWLVQSKVAGYVRQVGNLTEVMIRNAGHIAPYDQPWSCLDMIERFFRGIPFFGVDSVYV